MLRTEVSELMNKGNVMYEVAEKIEYRQQLNAEEKEIAEISDAWAREIGNKGRDNDCEIAEYVQKVVNESVYSVNDELIDSIFDKGTIGEDDYEAYARMPKNTLQAIECAKGGTVTKSYVDYSALAPIRKNRQIDTQLTYADLRRDGFKSIATLTTFAKEALQNALYYDAFDAIDKALVTGDNVVAVTGGAITEVAMDAFTNYLRDIDANSAMAVGLSKYTNGLAKMSGYYNFMSEGMKESFNRYGILPFYQGVKIATVSSQHKTGANQLLLPSNRLFGISNKAGKINLVGELRTTQTMDNANEKVNIYVKDFTYDIAITNIENCAKVTFTA